MHFLPGKFQMHVQEITRLYSCVESEADEDAKWQPPMEKHFSAYYKGRIRQKKKKRILCTNKKLPRTIMHVCNRAYWAFRKHLSFPCALQQEWRASSALCQQAYKQMEMEVGEKFCQCMGVVPRCRLLTALYNLQFLINIQIKYLIIPLLISHNIYCSI